MNKLKKRLYKPDHCELKQSDINHLRRLLAWMRCSNMYLYLEHDQHKSLADELDVIDGAKEKYQKRMADAYNKYPKYVHDAVKALQKTIHQIDGEVSDVDALHVREIGSPDISVTYQK